MGIPIGSSIDTARQVITGTFEAAGNGQPVMIKGKFNIALWGTFTATVVPERSFDGGTTFMPLTFSDGVPVGFTAPTSATWSEPEAGVIYRLHCLDHTAGTVNWRVSQ